MPSREKCCKMMKPQIFTLSEVFFLCLFSGCGVIHPSFRTYRACRQDWSLHLLLSKKRRGPVALRRKQSSRYLLKCSLGQTGVTGLPFCFLKKEAVKKSEKRTQSVLLSLFSLRVRRKWIRSKGKRTERQRRRVFKRHRLNKGAFYTICDNEAFLCDC